VFLDVHTYGGHPVSAAAALANLQIIEREGLVANSATVGAHLLGLLEALRSHPLVADVRGLGLFAAVELECLPAADAPRTDDIVAAVALQRGLFARPLHCTLLLAPPLTFTREQAARTVEILDEALSTAEQRTGTS
jgi:adenosylmethionine-8-amino-7-oxononanoate aminotransferase